MGQDGILRPVVNVVNRPVADEQPNAKSADAIGAQDAILPHNFSQLLVPLFARGLLVGPQYPHDIQTHHLADVLIGITHLH